MVQAASSARLLIVGQAPGSRVHATGIPWADSSGDRLRDWLGIATADFYDASRVAIVPMGFCYPGATANGGDHPPLLECAPRWHARLLGRLPDIRLTLLVGSHAQAYYLGRSAKPTMTATVQAYAEYQPKAFPLPHPSWRSIGWMRRQPWFEEQVLPALRRAMGDVLRNEN